MAITTTSTDAGPLFSLTHIHWYRIVIGRSVKGQTVAWAPPLGKARPRLFPFLHPFSCTHSLLCAAPHPLSRRAPRPPLSVVRVAFFFFLSKAAEASQTMRSGERVQGKQRGRASQSEEGDVNNEGAPRLALRSYNQELNSCTSGCPGPRMLLHGWAPLMHK